jgi:hypothetical protein
MQTNDQYPNGAIAVTPSNTVDLAKAATGFYVGVTGDVTLVDLYGNVTQFKAVPVGFQYFIGFTRINATGTTATNIVAFIP